MVSFTQLVPVLVVGLASLAVRTDTEPRISSNNSPSRQSQFSGQNAVSNRATYRGRVQCIQVTKYAEARRRGCVSKYECKQECTKKKDCKTRYKYKCTDYKRQECKNVWQNQCNGKRGKRDLGDQIEEEEVEELNGERDLGGQVEGLRGERDLGGQVEGLRGEPGDQPHSRVKRLIETEVVYDQSYPIPPSDVPFASPSQGQKFSFASPPKSKTCWKKVRECKWVKYRSRCRNEPVKECSSKLVDVCKKKCARVYYCKDCNGSKPTTKPKPTTPKPKPPRPTTSRPRPPSPVRPPSIPPSGTFIVRPPAPPSTLDVEIIEARNNRNGGDGRRKRQRGRYVP